MGGRISQFLPEPSDMDIDGSLSDKGIISKDSVQNLLPGHHHPLSLDQEEEKIEFRGCEIERSALPCDLIVGRSDYEVSYGNVFLEIFLL